MTLNSRIKVPMPENGVITRKSGKHPYVYKVLKTYRTSKGQPTNERKNIGRFDAESGMLIPNDRYWDYYSDDPKSKITLPSAALSFDSVRSLGATFLIRRILESLGLVRIIRDIFDQSRASSIMTAILYMVCRGNIFEHVLDWCEDYTLSESYLSSPTSSTLFSSITHTERMTFFRAWIAYHPQNGYIAYDVTSFSSRAAGIAETEWGHNRDNEKLPQINFGCYMKQESGLPVFYVVYPGSIVDKSHMQYMMAYNKELGIYNVCFVMDRGFCTTANITYMHSEQLPYVIGVEIGHKATRAAINEVRESMLSIRNLVRPGVYAQLIRSRFYGSASTMHIYYDPDLAERQRRDLYRSVEAEEEKLRQLEQLTKREARRYNNHFKIVLAGDCSFTYELDYGKVDNDAKNCGFFCLLTNTDIGSAETLNIYRRKDTIEKSFDDLKNHIDMKRLRTHSSSTTDGKMFCAFIALIATLEMMNRLSGFMKDKSMSKDSLIAELEKIKVVFMSDGTRLMNPLTKTQRTIFEACGLSEDDLKSYVNQYNENTSKQ